MAIPNQNPSNPILLNAKLHIPLQKPNLVIRQALIDRLNEGLQYNTGLYLISAPAGYGKTTLICEWLNSENLRHVWISLDENDNDPVRFLTYLSAAFRKIIPEVGQTIRNFLDLPQLPPVDVLITPLINILGNIDERIIMVLDNYHIIRNHYIQDIIQLILDNRPPLLYSVLLTREDPPLALDRMRAFGETIELRAKNLCFSESETAACLTGTMQLNLENEEITLLNMMSEGWIAGLQLAAITIRSLTQDKSIDFLIDFSCSHRYILDYLIAQVFTVLSEEIRYFLKQTTALDFLCAPLCNAVTGREDSQRLLELLERSNLFLISLDEEHQWFQYLHFFAESIRLDLSREERQAIHQKAAECCQVNGYLEEAIARIVSTDYQGAGLLIESPNNVNYALSSGWLSGLLSNREMELLRLVAKGLSNEEITRQLAISLNTTKYHLKNIFGKLGVKSRTQAVIEAKELHLI